MRNTNSPITTDDNCKGAGRIPNYHPLGITTVHIGGQHRNASVGEMVLQPHTHRDARVGALVWRLYTSLCCDAFIKKRL